MPWTQRSQLSQSIEKANQQSKKGIQYQLIAMANQLEG